MQLTFLWLPSCVLYFPSNECSMVIQDRCLLSWISQCLNLYIFCIVKKYWRKCIKAVVIQVSAVGFGVLWQSSSRMCLEFWGSQALVWWIKSHVNQLFETRWCSTHHTSVSNIYRLASDPVLFYTRICYLELYFSSYFYQN